MNRAILIVICDFLVSAMLSMMTGMVPAHTGGTGVGLDEQTTRALLAEMSENLAQLERTRDLLREAARKNGGATPEQTQRIRELAQQIVNLRRDAEMLQKGAENKDLAKLTAKELQQRLESELRRRLQAEMERNEQHKDLADREKELRDLRKSSEGALQTQAAVNANLSRSNAELANQNAEVNRRLAQSTEELRRAERELGAEKSRRELAESRAKDAESRAQERAKEAKITRDDLAKAKKVLEDLNARNARGSADLERSKTLLYTTKRELNKSEKETARLKDQNAGLAKRNRQLELELAQARTNNQALARTTKISIADLQKARKDLEAERIKFENAKTKSEEQEKRIRDKDDNIKVLTKQVEEANKKLRSRLMQNYADGAVRLKVDIREELMLGREQKGGGVYYLPLVEIDGRSFLVGHANQFLGIDGKNSLSYKDVKFAAISVSVPGAKNAAEIPLKGPVLLANAEPRLAAIPMNFRGRKAIPALTAAKLRERGVDDLFLVKAGSPGTDHAALAQRCSLDIAGNFFIRNAGSRREVRAEPGDLVFSREGEFVGIVTTVEIAPGTRRHGDQVRVFVLPDGRVWDGAKVAIAYTRPAGAEYFTDLENSAAKVRELIEPPKRRRRR